ncbi:TlpA disulfide reductase family protein [Parabacteroides sp. Marseille-P3160]|uniref:TlpA disulfide reductase family protein n=1 Tax=Parabacteroides sp. Marseille-P3160 TaxID=1917887 RepID=UPI0009BAAF70|nr:TlpA disulfide reductase family protein [Parabacteroides sp. Marseille-P3160]
MKQIPNRLLLACSVLLLLLSACSRSSDFKVKGVVTGADGQLLYLENVGLSSVITLDSMKLPTGGKFSFRQHHPEYPDFYRLRLNGNLINFAVDSTETITIQADGGTFSTSYTIEGSENSKAIKEITLAQLDANQTISRLRKDYEEKLIADTTYQRKVLAAVETYKETARRFIYSAPMSTAAYFALFQKVDGLLFFDLYDRTDSKSFGAVATSYDHFYPESPRSKHLKNLALQSIKVTRAARDRQMDLSKVEAKEIGFLDINLPTLDGSQISLSSVSGEGKVVLVNFTAYQTEWSGELNITLRDIYNKYKGKGLEIYQVSLDNDLHYWKNVAVNQPWICVRDPESVYSQIAALYNVKKLPALFLLDRKGNMTKRIDAINTIDADIQKLL